MACPLLPAMHTNFYNLSISAKTMTKANIDGLLNQDSAA